MTNNIKDPLFEDAANLVVASQVGSISLLQRRMKLGYNRAGKLMEQLEAAGIIGPNNGDNSRDVLIETHEELSKHLLLSKDVELEELKIQYMQQNKLVQDLLAKNISANSTGTQKQIIVHRSDWGRNVIKVIIGVAIILGLYKTNPPQQKFQQYIIKEYAKKEGIDPLWAQLLSYNISPLLDNFIERNNYVFFSTYSFEYGQRKITVLGIVNNFIPIEDSTTKQQAPKNKTVINWQQ